jgi:hypothetical protein
LITVPELAAEALGSFLAKQMSDRFGSTHADPPIRRNSTCEEHRLDDTRRFPLVHPRGLVSEHDRVRPAASSKVAGETRSEPSRHHSLNGEQHHERTMVACAEAFGKGFLRKTSIVGALSELQSIGRSSFSSMAILRSLSWARDSICRTRSLVIPSSRPSCSRVCSLTPLIP